MFKPGIGTIYTLSPCVKCGNKQFKQINTMGTRFQCTNCGTVHALSSEPEIKITGISPDNPSTSLGIRPGGYTSKGISPK